MKELEKWLTLEIVGKYHQTIHRTLLRPPMAVWRDGTEAARAVDMMDNADALTTCPQRQHQTKTLAA